MGIERESLDRLLAAYPDYDVLSIDWQLPNLSDRVARFDPGPWILVELGQRIDASGTAFLPHLFAIWKKTGNVYRVGLDGAVADDPFLSAEDP